MFSPIIEEEGPVCETYIIRTQKRNSGENLNVLAVKYEGALNLTNVKGIKMLENTN